MNVKLKGRLRVPSTLDSKQGPVPLDNLHASRANVCGGHVALTLESIKGQLGTLIHFEWHAELPESAVVDGAPPGMFLLHDPVSGTLGSSLPLIAIHYEVRDIVTRLALATGHFGFAASFIEKQPADTFEDVVHMTCEGRPPATFRVGRDQVGSLRNLEAPDRLRDLDASAVTDAVSLQAHPSDIFLLRSERARHQTQYREWVVDLVTALEVKAYEVFARRRGHPAGRKDAFSPKKFLADELTDPLALGSTSRFNALYPSEFARVCQLWGTRHEVVHNGRLLVREFDAAKLRDDENRTQPFTPTIVEPFREAVWKAFRWLDSL